MKPEFLGKKLLVFTAHPDDESYTAAGTIHQNHQKGGSTYLVCATFGERGTSHLKKLLPISELKQLRKKELVRAARFLHISKLHIIGVPDGKVNSYKRILLKQGTALARKYRPEFIISFGSDGISGHQDHIAVGKIARHIAQKLFIPFVAFALPPRVKDRAIKWLKVRRRAPHYVRKVTFQAPNTKIVINPSIKKKVLQLHKSQMDNENAFTGFPLYAVRELLKAEYFIS